MFGRFSLCLVIRLIVICCDSNLMFGCCWVWVSKVLKIVVLVVLVVWMMCWWLCLFLWVRWYLKLFFLWLCCLLWVKGIFCLISYWIVLWLCFMVKCIVFLWYRLLLVIRVFLMWDFMVLVLFSMVVMLFWV